MSKIIYISGALTDMSEEERQTLREFYEALGKICREFGFEPYIPHIFGDPKNFPDLTTKQVDRLDRLAVTQSYLVAVYLGVSSTGVGIELELSHHANKPVVLLYEKEKLNQDRITRLARGSPAAIEHIVFDDFQNAEEKFRDFLKKFCNQIKSEKLPPPLTI